MSINKHIEWFFVIFSNDFRQKKIEAFEMVMFLAVAHFFGCYNPNQLADYLGIGHQGLYRYLSDLSIYSLKRLLLRFMVKQASEQLNPVMEKSAATRSRAGITISVDNTVIDRCGKFLRCVWSWYSGRWKKVVDGHDLLGIVMTINGIAFPLSLLFCSKQGRGNTNKPDLLISMLNDLIEAFNREGIDLTRFPITMDSWYASNDLKLRLHDLGFVKVIIAGKGNYTFTIKGKKQKASEWKKQIRLIAGQWGIDVPFRRVHAFSPTFGELVICFYSKNTTSNYYLMDFSQTPLRGSEIWSIWKHHFIIEVFWKVLKSVLGIKDMRMRSGEGLYAGLLVKVSAYLLAIRLKLNDRSYFKMSITQIMRKIRRELDLEEILDAHFHLQISEC